MRKAVEVNRFKPFLVGRGKLPVSILQYADDTLCIGEASVGNLWTLKAMLRGFEMASGLKVNFFKSCLVGVNLSDDFLGMASNFLNCRIGRTPFKYLGLMVGGNPRSLATWEPMLNTIRGRLGNWGNRYVSLGGRIVMLNVVLSAIPIFYLSFLKMPIKVWKEVVKIQRKFLWGGLSRKNKTCWVKWDDICKPKEEGGLGVRDLRLVNVAFCQSGDGNFCFRIMLFGKRWLRRNMVEGVGEVYNHVPVLLQLLRLDGGWIFVILTKTRIGLLVQLKRRLVMGTTQNFGSTFGWVNNRFVKDFPGSMEFLVRRKL
jgi:hypothetical protein